VSKTSTGDVETGRLTLLQDKSREEPAYCLGGVRHRGGVNLSQALVWNVGTCRSDAKEETQSGGPTRIRVPMRDTEGVKKLVEIGKGG
jgi:hypothetical protein